MAEILSFPFAKESFEKIKQYKYGLSWPVVYVAENGREIYIGQTVSLLSRSRQHYDNPDRRRLSTMHVITDDEFNVSAALDIESSLIQYISADEKYQLQNGNSGMQNHNYYDREKYKAKFELIWEKLREMEIVSKSLNELKNSDLFKYSPYKSLTDDQQLAVFTIVEDIIKHKEKTFVVSGKPGTGKTILAVYLFKYLKEKEETKNMKVALVVPMTSLRKTIKKVFKNIKGLSGAMVIGPNDAVKDNYDILIIDEAHRLRRRKNITNYAAFDQINKKLGLTNEGNELDWIVRHSKYQVFFYDSAQSVRPSDVREQDFKDLNVEYQELSTQMRVEGGPEYLRFIEDLFDGTVAESDRPKIKNEYDFKLYKDIHAMVSDIKKHNDAMSLCRVVAGYAWPWHTNPKKEVRAQDHDIEIDGLKLCWNSTPQDWINSPNSINEVGCIHTVQGYDLNYVAVIIGPELSYDPVTNEFKIDKEAYFDINGRAGVHDPKELERYIINIYKTLLTRGIKGTYVYIVDDNLRQYFEECLSMAY